MFVQEKDLIGTAWLRRTGSELSVHLPWMLILLHGELRIKFTSLDFYPFTFLLNFKRILNLEKIDVILKCIFYL